MATLNGEKFGFDMSFSKKGGCNTRLGNYMSMSDGKNLRIVLDTETAERVREICGERVAFGMDKGGRVILAPGNATFGRKMTKSSKYSHKSTIYCATMTDEYKKLMGQFTRLYMEAGVYAGGDAVVLTPNGNVDRV